MIVVCTLDTHRQTTKLRRTVISTPDGRTVGLNEREWGQIGVMTMQETLGWTILAPAASEYAVLPVGVDMITPEIDIVEMNIR